MDEAPIPSTSAGVIKSASGANYCDACDRHFTNSYLLRRHLNGSRCKKNSYPCPKCGAVLQSFYSQQRHLQRYHNDDGVSRVYACGLCDEGFQDKDDLQRHRLQEHQPHSDFRLRHSAHSHTVQSLRAFIPEHVNTLDETLEYAYDNIKSLLTKMCTTMSYFKATFVVSIQMHRLDENNEISQSEMFPFRTYAMSVSSVRDFTRELAMSMGDIDRSVMEFLNQGSGWIVDRGIFIDAEISKCEPLRGQADHGEAELHEMEYLRGAGLHAHIEAHDSTAGECFYKAIASFFLGSGAGKEALDDFIAENINKLPSNSLGVPVSEIKRFQRLNSHLDMNLNVLYEDEKRNLLPVHAGKKVNAKNTVVLVLFNTIRGSEKSEPTHQHYALARDPEKLFAHRFSKDGSKNPTTRSVFTCWNCFNVQRSKSGYENHIKFCHQMNCQKVEMPKPHERKTFNQVDKANSKVFKSAYILIYDFEALHVSPGKPCSCSEEVLENTARVKREEEEWEGLSREEKEERSVNAMMTEGEATRDWENEMFERVCQNKKVSAGARERYLKRKLEGPKVCKHKTHVIAEQPPFSYGYVLVDRNAKVLSERTYVGMDAAEDFLDHILMLADEYLPKLSPGTPMDELNSFEREIFMGDNYCYLCGHQIGKGDKVLDHDHLTGEVLGVAHNSCNLRRRELSKLTCFSHNFTGYDSHFLVKALPALQERIFDTFAIPTTSQKMKALILNKRITFLDSMAFIDGSLSDLVDMLIKGSSTFPIFEQLVGDIPGNDILKRKGAYPYSFATSIDKLYNKKELPSREEFKNHLTNEDISKFDYDFAKEVWQKFNCENMIEYTMIYLRTDVFLLADVVVDLRDNIWEAFGLDMCQYFSLPHISMDAMLKQTGVSLEYITNQEMSHLVRSNIRGGLSFVNRRYVEVDNFDKSISYVDVNALYSSAMRYPLPMGEFEWMGEMEVELFDWRKELYFDNETGYFLEVDLEYPPYLHLPHNSFPLCPENVEITFNDLSSYSKKCLGELGKSIKYKSKKLTATFHPRYNKCGNSLFHPVLATYCVYYTGRSISFTVST